MTASPGGEGGDDGLDVVAGADEHEPAIGSEVAGQLADRGQLVAGADLALGERLAEARDDLVLEGPGAGDVDAQH